MKKKFHCFSRWRSTKKVRKLGGKRVLVFPRHFHFWWVIFFFLPCQPFLILFFLLLVFWCLLCLPPTKQMPSSAAGAAKKWWEKKREPHAALQPAPSLPTPTQSKPSHYTYSNLPIMQGIMAHLICGNWGSSDEGRDGGLCDHAVGGDAVRWGVEPEKG